MFRLSLATWAMVFGAAASMAACRAGVPLPTATATLGWASVSLPRGSFCWHSGGSGTCVDSAGALLRSGDLKPFTIAGGVTALIKFSSSPRQVEVTLGPAGRGGSVAHTGTFDLPSTPGDYLYLISGTWPEGMVDFYLPVHVIPGLT